jgi:uncharacterized protein YraI
MKNALYLSAAAALLVMSAPAMAQQAVSATTDLNIRQGPGPQYPVVGVIGADGQATLEGCAQGSKWCMVTAGGVQGWAYSDYLVADMSGREVIVTEHVTEFVPTETYTRRVGSNAAAGGATAGMATGAVAGAIVGGPVGAAIGGVAGAATGGIAGAAVEPTPEVTTYVRRNQVDPVYLDGEVVVGATLPPEVEFYEVPDYEYRYVYVNGVPALVEPETRRVVYIVR